VFDNVRFFFWAINGGGYWLLTHSFDTVVFGALSGCIGSLCDSVVSRTGRFLFPCRLVRYFSNSILFLRSPRRLCHCSNTQTEESTSRLRAARSPNASKLSPFVHVPSGRLEVTVHKAYEEHAMSDTNNFGSSYTGSDGQLHRDDKPHEISFDENTDEHAK
jgi:hypothetical protein